LLTLLQLAGPAADKLGRRWTIVIGSVIYLLGGGLQTGAQNLSFLWAGRWLAGLGMSTNSRHFL